MDQTVTILFWSITQEPLSLLKFLCYFEFLGQFTIRSIYNFQKGVDDFEIQHKKFSFLVRGAVPRYQIAIIYKKNWKARYIFNDNDG